MAISLAGVTVTGGEFETASSGINTLDIIIRGTSLTAAQMVACSNSANGGARVTLNDGSKSYTGRCLKVVCITGYCMAFFTDCI